MTSAPRLNFKVKGCFHFSIQNTVVQARVVELRRELEEVKARQADADRARQADADLRKEVEEVKARQADMEEIKRHRRGDVEYLAELKTLIYSEIQGWLFS